MGAVRVGRGIVVGVMVGRGGAPARQIPRALVLEASEAG